MDLGRIKWSGHVVSAFLLLPKVKNTKLIKNKGFLVRVRVIVIITKNGKLVGTAS